MVWIRDARRGCPFGRWFEDLDAFLNADLDTGEVLLRDYVDATGEFRKQLGAQLHKIKTSHIAFKAVQGRLRATLYSLQTASAETAINPSVRAWAMINRSKGSS
ncbi:hypothetical protein ThimaDRAFT_3124 [Thiocapsa marina 5811]|uniref:Uncharacterized protein n=1 Tax=Thiocapsa marina 5811 TaxID=768671 RepID=F9UE22_9GAMM|nr:hypothetical protein ThimaDRAFT_3124 [Thiocapsa marina 5811]